MFNINCKAVLNHSCFNSNMPLQYSTIPAVSVATVPFEYGIFDVLCQGMPELWESMRQSHVSRKAQVVFLPHMQAIKIKYGQLLENVPNMKDGICHVFILRELNFHTNSQCSGMCKGWLNTMHHPWFPWRLWSLYDNRIPTIAVKTLIPAWSKNIITWIHRWGIWLRDGKQPSEETLCSWASLQGRTLVSLQQQQGRPQKL